MLMLQYYVPSKVHCILFCQTNTISYFMQSAAVVAYFANSVHHMSAVSTVVATLILQADYIRYLGTFMC